MGQTKNNNRWAPLIVIVLLGGSLFLVKQCKKSQQDQTTTTTHTTKTKEVKETRGLDRNPSAINYSKHARCRMACRHIDESEVKEILRDGKINYSKSEIGDYPDCKRKYAVEGDTHDDQRVRIIFAPCQSEVTVVTVIDLDTEWTCDCE